MKGEKEDGCTERDWKRPDGTIKVYECLCQESKCNKYTDEETSTEKSTTKHGKIIFVIIAILEYNWKKSHQLYKTSLNIFIKQKKDYNATFACRTIIILAIAMQNMPEVL